MWIHEAETDSTFFVVPSDEDTALNRAIEQLMNAASKKSDHSAQTTGLLWADIVAFETKSQQNAARVEAGLKFWEKKSAKGAVLSTTLLTLAACGGSSSDGAMTKSGSDSFSDKATLSDDVSVARVQGTLTGATIRIDDISSDVLNASVTAKGVTASDDVLMFKFEDKNDLVILSGSVTDFAVIEVVKGTVDFRALGADALDSVTLKVGSGAIVSAEQALVLKAVELRDNATEGKLQIDFSEADLDVEQLKGLLNKISGVDVTSAKGDLSAAQLEALEDAGIPTVDEDDSGASIGLELDPDFTDKNTKSAFTGAQETIDIAPAMKIVAIDGLDWTRVNVQNVVLADVNGDGLTDMVFPLWMNTDRPQEPISGPVQNGIVVALQESGRIFVNGTIDLFGTVVAETNGIGIRGVGGDINGDGYADLLFPSNLEDGRLATETNHSVPATLFLSNPDGTFETLSLGTAQWGYTARIFEDIGAEVDILLAPFGFIESFTYVNGEVVQTDDYAWLTDVHGVFFGNADTGIHALSRDIGEEVIVGAWVHGQSGWTRIDTINVLGTPIGYQQVKVWNGNITSQAVYEVGDELVTLLSLSESTVLDSGRSALWIMEYSVLENGMSLDVIDQDVGMTSRVGIFKAEIEHGGIRFEPLTLDAQSPLVMPFAIEPFRVSAEVEGFAFIPWGSGAKPRIFIETEDWTYTEVNPDLVPDAPSYFGTTTSTVFDFDGDGYSDILYWPLTGVSESGVDEVIPIIHYGMPAMEEILLADVGIL